MSNARLGDTVLIHGASGGRGGGSTFQVVRPFNDKLEVVRPFGNNGSFSQYAKQKVA